MIFDNVIVARKIPTNGIENEKTNVVILIQNDPLLAEEILLTNDSLRKRYKSLVEYQFARLKAQYIQLDIEFCYGEAQRIALFMMWYSGKFKEEGNE
jgi:hypothetical protein